MGLPYSKPAFSKAVQRMIEKNDIRDTDAYRVSGELKVTDDIMQNSFWLGVYPGMDEDMLDYMSDTVKAYLKEKGCAL